MGATLKAMSQHLAVVDVQRQGCRVLKTLVGGAEACGWSKFRERVIATGGLQMTLIAMRKHPAEMSVQQKGCLALESFARDNKCREEVLAAVLGVSELTMHVHQGC